MKQRKNELASVIEILKSDILLPTCPDLWRCYVVLIQLYVLARWLPDVSIWMFGQSSITICVVRVRRRGRKLRPLFVHQNITATNFSKLNLCFDLHWFSLSITWNRCITTSTIILFKCNTLNTAPIHLASEKESFRKRSLRLVTSPGDGEHSLSDWLDWKPSFRDEQRKDIE